MPLSIYDRVDFLRKAGWGGSQEKPVGSDWSQRKYFRITKGTRTAILLHGVPDHDPRATPGHKFTDFIEIGRFLKNAELSVPTIYASDLQRGLMLIEDFGSHEFTEFADIDGPQRADIYRLATRCLVYMYKKVPVGMMDVPSYFDSHIHTGRRRVVDWYVPAVLGRENPDHLVDEYLSIWTSIEKSLPPVTIRFQHGDFHPGNLYYLPDRSGIAQVGLIDYQGGVKGPAPYDLVNLLEDARRIVPDDIRMACLDLFVVELGEKEKESFLAWYPVLAAQFHFRVIGQAIKLAVRSDITRLMDLIPVLCAHIKRDLSNPLLAPLKDWFDGLGVTFDPEAKIDLKQVVPLIRPDAF